MVKHRFKVLVKHRLVSVCFYMREHIVRWNKFFNFLSNFLHSFMLIWPLQILLISWLLIKKVSVLRFLHFGDFNNSLLVQLLGGSNIEGRGDILVNFSWLWIFCLHILTIFHYEIRQFSICINVGCVCIDHITFFNQLSC